MLRTRVYKSQGRQRQSLTQLPLLWETCINCKQSFKGQLALDMGTTLVVFAESTYYNVDDR